MIRAFNKDFIDVPAEQREIIQQELAISNMSRVTLFAKIGAVAEFSLLYVDYQDYTRGYWQVSPGYKLLLYSHILFIVCMLIVIVLNFHSHIRRGKAPFLVNAGNIVFSAGILGLSAWVSGCIEQLIHIQTIVYILASFFVAAIVHFRPITRFILYGASYALFLNFLNKYQTDPVILRANYVNGTLLLILAWSFSVILSKSRIRDLEVKRHLEKTVQERTKELMVSNINLKREIEERKWAAEKTMQLAAIVESSIDGIFSLTFNGIISRDL